MDEGPWVVIDVEGTWNKEIYNDPQEAIEYAEKEAAANPGTQVFLFKAVTVFDGDVEVHKTYLNR